MVKKDIKKFNLNLVILFNRIKNKKQFCFSLLENFKN
jgi:hypothetical protein